MAIRQPCQTPNFPELIVLSSTPPQQTFSTAFGYAIIQQYIRLSDHMQADLLLESVNQIQGQATGMLPGNLQDSFFSGRQVFDVLTSPQYQKSQRLGWIDHYLNQHGQEFGIFMQYMIAACLQGKSVCNDILQTGGFQTNDLNLVVQNLASSLRVNIQIIFAERSQRDIIVPKENGNQQIIIILLYSNDQYMIPQHTRMMNIDQNIDYSPANLEYPFICTTNNVSNFISNNTSAMNVNAGQVPGLGNAGGTPGIPGLAQPGGNYNQMAGLGNMGVNPGIPGLQQLGGNQNQIHGFLNMGGNPGMNIQTGPQANPGTPFGFQNMGGNHSAGIQSTQGSGIGWIQDSPPRNLGQIPQNQQTFGFQQPQSNALRDILEEFAKIAHPTCGVDANRLEQALNQIQQQDPSVQQAAQSLIQRIRQQQFNQPPLQQIPQPAGGQAFQPTPQQSGSQQFHIPQTQQMQQPQNQSTCTVHQRQIDYPTSNCTQMHCVSCLYDIISAATGSNFTMAQIRTTKPNCNHNVQLTPRDAAQIYRTSTGTSLHLQG